MSFNDTYAEALEKARSHPARPRTQMKRGSGLQRSRIKVRKFSKTPTGDGSSERDLRDECDSLVRQILKLRDLCCMTLECSETQALEVSHFIKRGVLALRWNLQNCNLQCPKDNRLHNTNREPYRRAMVLFYGEVRVAALERCAKDNPRMDYCDIVEVRDGLRADLAERKA